MHERDDERHNAQASGDGCEKASQNSGLDSRLVDNRRPEETTDAIEHRDKPDAEGVSEDMMKRGKSAARKFLEAQGLEIIQEDYEFVGWDTDFICWDHDDNCIVFVQFKVDDLGSGFSDDEQNKLKRASWEHAALAWITINEDYTDCKVRADSLKIIPISDGKRAMLRHHVNLFSQEM